MVLIRSSNNWEGSKKSNINDTTAGAEPVSSTFPHIFPFLVANYRMCSIMAYLPSFLSTHADVSNVTRFWMSYKPYEPSDVICFNNFHVIRNLSRIPFEFIVPVIQREMQIDRTLNFIATFTEYIRQSICHLLPIPNSSRLYRLK